MNATEWLLGSDPAIRWQALRDLQTAPADEVAAERARVANEGWGRRLLALQGPDGQWAGGAYFPEGLGTTPVLLLLRDMGIDPNDPKVERAVVAVREHSRWEHAGQRYFDGEVEPCINGMAVAIGAYFGQDVSGIVARLLGEQMDDGGWNCEQENGSTRGSFHTTIQVLEGLLEFERANGATPALKAARERGQEYLLERRLLRRLSTGEIIDRAYLRFSYPPTWHYDVLRALDYFRAAGVRFEGRMDEALEAVRQKQRMDGRWPLENPHVEQLPIEMDPGVGQPSLWNTLRGLRVLRWAEGARE